MDKGENMKKVVSLLVLGAFTTFCFASCASLEGHHGAATGAAVGAGAGALVGAAAASEGKGVQGAIIGGLIGGLIGGAVGHYAYDRKKTQAETNKTYGYTQQNQGVSVRIEGVEVKPKTLKPGQKLDMNLTYAVLTQTQDPVFVRETREIFSGDTLWGNPETTVERTGGTYVSTVPVFLPNDMKKGTYRIRFTIESSGARDTRETTFTVK